MAKKIAIANQKGGVGKTTTTLNLADALMHCGYNVLVLDLDPQCNTTGSYQAKTVGEYTLYDVMNKICTSKEAIQKTEVGDIIAGDPKLVEIDSKLKESVGGYNVMKKALKEVEEQYDYIIMDTPPNLGVFMLNALTAANGVIIPIKAEKYAIDGLGKLNETIQEVIDNTNENLEIYGILLTAFDTRNKLDRNIKDQLEDYGEASDTKIFKPIRVNQTIKDAQAESVSLFEKDSTCNGAVDYANLVKELFEIVGR